MAIEPNHPANLGNYANNLSRFAKIKQDPTLFEKAFEQYEKALKLQPNMTYNFACYYSITKNFELCKENLLHADLHNTLPNWQHLSEDQDLEVVRNEPWFIELLQRLKSKDENLDNVS